MPFSSIVSIVLAQFVPAMAYLANFTIDDALAHYAAQVRLWEARSGDDGCAVCLAQPDPKFTYGGTWHDKTTFPGEASSNITFSFNGTALYVFFILANRVDFGNADTHLAFHLDGEASPAGTFDHTHDSAVDGFLYNQLVFASGSLPTGEHSVAIRCLAKGASPSLALFDYAVYSADVAETTASSPAPSTTAPASPRPGSARSGVGTAVGAAVGAAAGVACLSAAALAFWIVRRRRKRGSPSGELEVVPDSEALSTDIPRPPRRSYKASRLGIVLAKPASRGGRGSVADCTQSDTPPLYAP